MSPIIFMSKNPAYGASGNFIIFWYFTGRDEKYRHRSTLSENPKNYAAVSDYKWVQKVDPVFLPPFELFYGIEKQLFLSSYLII